MENFENFEGFTMPGMVKDFSENEQYSYKHPALIYPFDSFQYPIMNPTNQYILLEPSFELNALSYPPQEKLFEGPHFMSPANILGNPLSSSPQIYQYPEFLSHSSENLCFEESKWNHSPKPRKSRSLPTKLNAKGTKPVKYEPKNHACSICGKRFTRPSSLATHNYSHTGEKPFKCTASGCGKCFSVLSNLRRHYKIHMKNEEKHKRNQLDTSADSNCLTLPSLFLNPGPSSLSMIT